MKEKSVRLVVFGIVLVLLASAAVGTASAFSNSGGGDWKYYKEITVKENSGKTLTNFQVLVELNPSNFPANAKSDGSDLRFEDANGKELNYWIEEWNAGAKKAKIWVKMPSIPANDETKIKMYYGNPSASGVSDGGNTFIEFMDKRSVNEWVHVWKYSGDSSFIDLPDEWSIVNEYLHFYSTKGYASKEHKVKVPEKYIIESLEKAEQSYRLIGFDNPSLDSRIFDIYWHTYEGEEKYRWATGVEDTEDYSISKASPNKYYRIKIAVDENRKKVDYFVYDYISDSLVASFLNKDYTYHAPQHLNYIAIVDGFAGCASNIYTKYILVRKYTSPEPTLTFSAEHPTVKPKSATSYVYYEEDFETDPGYTSLASEYAYWDSEQGNYYVKTYDNLAHKYWAYSPKFQTVDVNRDIIVELDMMCENLDWGTYPGVAFSYDNPDTIEGYIFKVEFHWDDPYGKNLGISDSYKHTHWANTQPKSNVWYHVKLKYHSSIQKADIYITEKSTGESFFIKENADFRIDPFCYLGIGYYNEPDYGNEWSPIRVDNIRIAAIGKPPVPTPTSTPPTAPAGKIKAVWLYNPNKYDSTTLMTDLKSAGINTVFLSTDVNNIWKYERFVKSAHENGIEVHAMILEDPRCVLKENHASSIKAVETVLNYNDKSLAKFDGINIDIEPYVDSDLEQVWQDYITLLEAIHEKTAGKAVLSADIPRWYDEGKIKDLAPNVDFFVVMAYDSGSAGWNTASEIEDAVASEMGAIRGEGSDAVIGIGVHEGFRDKDAVEKCIEDLYNYYSDDPAFHGVSIFKYETYSGLAGAPEVTVPTGEEVTPIPGFEAVFSIAGLLTVAYLLRRRK